MYIDMCSSENLTEIIANCVVYYDRIEIRFTSITATRIKIEEE